MDQMIATHGIKPTLNTIAKMSGYVSCPPTIEEFLDDDEFMGSILGGDKIYPYWRHELYEIYPNPFNSPYFEIVVTGAIGLGKSTFSKAGNLYDICKLLHVKNPQEKYSILKTETIVLALMNATMGLANDVLMGEMMAWINESPFFKRALKRSSGRTLLPNNIDIKLGSRPGHFLGKAVFGTVLSEINFQNRIANQAAENYNGIRQRIQSRYQTSNNPYPGRIWVDSSKTDSGSFVEDFLLKDRDPEDLEKIRVIDKARWEVLPSSKLALSGKTFKVFVGDQFRDPFIVDDSKNQLIGLDESHLLDVPVEFAPEFRLDLYKSLQDIAGRSTQASHKFISSTEMIEKAFQHENPVSKVVVSVDMYDQNEILVDFIIQSQLDTDRRPRFVHIDLGLVNDKTGIACTRLDGLSTVRRFDPILNKHIELSEPIFKTEWVMSIESRPGQQVPIYKIKNLMKDLRSRGCPITVVSTDGFQSSSLRQDLSVEHFDTDLISVDRTTDPYLVLKNAILEGRWKGPNHPILSKEIKNLVFTGGKVDHPTNGSKDISDAVAGSLASAKKHMYKYGANTTSEDLISAIRGQTAPRNAYEKLLGMRVS